jgi:hypothetical protein
VGRRRRLLEYLKREDLDRYRALIADLGLRHYSIHARGGGRRWGAATFASVGRSGRTCRIPRPSARGLRLPASFDNARDRLNRRGNVPRG